MKKNKSKEKEIKLIDITKIRYSPEFEFLLPTPKMSKTLIDRGRTLKGWEIKFDGSLKNKNEEVVGIELSPENRNHLYYNEDSLMQIKEILSLVRCYKGKAMPNCGLHIHVSTKLMSDKQVLNLIKEWIHRQKYIIKRFGTSKERLEDTCKLLPKSELHKLTEKEIHAVRNNLKTSFRSYSYLDEKYFSLNAMHLSKNSYGTLEFRCFESTTNFKEIKSIIYFVLTFCQQAMERD
jgi:hypothetical protein